MFKNNVLFPTGDYLRQLVGQTNVQLIELKKITRKRGIFICNEDKKTVGTILIKTGLSPFEYSELKESYKTKEEREKTQTRSIKWSSDKSILDAISDSEVMDYESLLDDQFRTCQLTKPPSFFSVNGNPNHITMDFEISRQDITKNWGDNETTHRGRIELKKDSDNNLIVSLTHTAPETKKYVNKVLDRTIKQFKETGDIDKHLEIKVIKFSDFNNEGRIAFLNELTQHASSDKLVFQDTKDIDVSPDNDAENPPENLKWMIHKIEKLKLKGKELHSTFFIQEKQYHKYIKLFGLACEYKFECKDYSGSCKILYEFIQSDETQQTSELTLNITVIKIDVNNIGISKDDTKKLLLESLEKSKIDLYDKYKTT